MKVVDPNLKVTDTEYDALGRLVRVWLPDRSREAGQSPNVKYAYQIRTDKPVVITTEKIRNDGSYSIGYQLFDSFMRPRQTQAQGPRGGWLLADTLHTSTGKIAKKNAAYFALGTPGDTPIIVPEGAVNGQTSYLYDGADRVTNEIFSVAGDEQWRTKTSYEGDRVHVEPPAGGTPTTTITDARGNTTELHQYRGAVPSGPANVTRYTYTPAGALAAVVDAAGNSWEYSYNLRGQKIEAKDPDAGKAAFEYDEMGRVKASTDARGGLVSHVYDDLGRKTQTWQGKPGSGTKLAEWSYDELAKGQLHWSARFVGGKAYGVTSSNLDALYRPGKTTYTIPSAAGAGLAGTYDFTTAYNADGTVQSAGMPEAGGLPAEAVVTSYDQLGRPVSLAGRTPYATATSYADTGELAQLALSTGGKKAWFTYSYERGTGRLTRFRVDRQDIAAIDIDARYSYDDGGNLLSIADTPSGGQRDIQCFGYDYQRRLTEAWATDRIAADPCAGGAQATGVGGPAPYHLSWTFDDATGNRKRETEHNVAGGPDTVRDYTYPAAKQLQPHTVRQVVESGPAGEKTSVFEYDKAGNTTVRKVAGEAGQDLVWDAEGHVASVTAGGRTTSFVYDASGSRLLRKEPDATTVYLPGMELRLDHTSRAVSATRFYAFGGRTVAVRTTTGVYFEASDHHGTATCSIHAETGEISWRRSTPYGGRRGSAPKSWPDQRGFVGGTQDPTTGLTHLGAREYDSALGRFLSVDPQIDYKDPQQMNGYAYAGNNPIGMSDPSGLWGFHSAVMKMMPIKGTFIGPTAPICSGDYCIGAPREPVLEEMQDDFVYDPSQKPTGDDYRRRALAHGMLAYCRHVFNLGGPICGDMDDNIEEFNNYLDGDGSDWEFNYEEAYREDALIRDSVDDELDLIQRNAADLARTTGLTSFQITGKNHRWRDGAETLNWKGALGSYNRWSSADVTVDGDKVTMKVTVHGVDRWNFNNNMSYMGIKDEYFGRLSVVGLAKNYTLRGTITREVSFTLGGSTPPSIQGPPKPGRTQSEGNRCQFGCR